MESKARVDVGRKRERMVVVVRAVGMTGLESTLKSRVEPHEKGAD